MFRQLCCSALLLSATLAGSQAAHAENRLALVIGESAYRSVAPLPNPANDAKAVAKLLADSGFEVTSAADLSREDMNREVSDFAVRIAGKGADTVALVFYAGHGVQIDGENYLVPVDVDPKREADIPLQAVRLNDVLNTLNSVPSRMRILLLDACRNNPFPAINQTAGHGLALVDTKSGAPGTFLSYSTSPGAEAEDGNGTDSPYTTALLKAAREPGLPIEQAFKRVRVDVNKATEGRQTPWDSSSLTEDFRFIPATDVSAANAGPMPVQAKRGVDEWKRSLKGQPVEVAHEMIVADGTLEAYQAFVVLFTQGPLAAEARTWLDLHVKMVAWDEAVLVNTAASYQSFLAKYPDSDLTATASKLIERLRYRPNVLPVVAAAYTPPAQPTSLGPCTAPSTPQPLSVPVKKVDLAPSAPPAVTAKGDKPSRGKRKVATSGPRDPEPPARGAVDPSYPDDLPPPVIYHRPPMLGYPGPVRMGLGGMGFRGGMGMGVGVGGGFRRY
ncbi:MAG: caspase family protein [Bradyrhizobium sp.]|uniref:caspase family protein n=1 Tax=Bradyrhizobium sp. TaxID=376 RepID=UPI001DAECFE7|nr:caspase family protein [Bradyrhizobium sp.]MBV9566391.1 caspase family protein [Bradyrhizobium sp.]